MAEVVALGVADDVLEALSDVTVRRAEDPAGLGAIDEVTTLAVVAPADAGAALAQAVHGRAPQAAVVLVADDPARRDALLAELALTPGIGRHTTCVLAGSEEGRSALVEEVERARLRLEHRQALQQARTMVGGFAAPPETASVYLGQLFHHAPLGILLVGTDGEVRVANPACGEVLGWQPGQDVHQPLATLFGGEDGAAAAALVEACVRGGEPARATLTRPGPDGAPQVLDVTATPVDPEQWDLGVFVLLRDDTARVLALEATERARRDAEAEADRYAELAWTLQESLLPPDLPAIPGVALGARFHPAGDGSQLGGDFYDIFQVTEDEWLAVIGDVCGKGAGAARLTALTRYTLRAATIRTRSIEGNLADLNAALSHQYELDRPRGQHRFATATAVRFRPVEGGGLAVEAGSGGHPPPVVVRAAGGVEVLGCRGPLLGVFPGGAFTSAQTRLDPGDVLLLYTDGVIEARRDREEYGEDRLLQLLAELPGSTPDRVAGAVARAVLSFQAGDAHDDIAVLALGPIVS